MLHEFVHSKGFFWALTAIVGLGIGTVAYALRINSIKTPGRVTALSSVSLATGIFLAAFFWDSAGRFLPHLLLLAGGIIYIGSSSERLRR